MTKNTLTEVRVVEPKEDEKSGSKHILKTLKHVTEGIVVESQRRTTNEQAGERRISIQFERGRC